MRKLNSCIAPISCKYEDLSVILTLLKENAYFVTRDMQDGYFHVKIHPLSVPLLSFRWNKQIWTHLALPFGLSQSPGIFSMVIQTLPRYWRTQGIVCSSYLDDLFLTHSNQVILKEQANFIQKECTECGIFLDSVKGNPEPTQRGIILGFLIDTVQMKIFIPPVKIEQILIRMRALLQCSVTITPRKLYGAASVLMACQRASYQLRSRTYSLYKESRAKEWDLPVILTQEAILDLQWILDNLNRVNGRSFNIIPQDFLELQIDASPQGFSGVIIGTNLECRSIWTNQEKEWHINVRELLTVYKCLIALQQHLVSKKLLIKSDSTCTVSYLLKGGGHITQLNEIMKLIVDQIWSLNITLLPAQHIPGVNNQVADFGSRNYELEGWELRTSTFLKLDKKWGPFTVDRFADTFNTHLPIFNSRWHCLGSQAVNALAQDWIGENNYCFPPPSLIMEVLQKFLAPGIKGALVVPVQQEAHWWNLFTKLTTELIWLKPSDFRAGPSSSMTSLLNLSKHFVVGQIGGKI